MRGEGGEGSSLAVVGRVLRALFLGRVLWRKMRSDLALKTLLEGGEGAVSAREGVYMPVVGKKDGTAAATGTFRLPGSCRL